MLSFKNIKLVRKIQLAILGIASVSTIIAVVALIQIIRVKEQKVDLNESYFNPKDQIQKIDLNFRTIQYACMKFSIAGFESSSQENIKFIEERKKVIDAAFKQLNEKTSDPKVKTSLEEIQKVWKEYKNTVVDAVVSAGLMNDKEMASVITTTSGEDVAAKVNSKFKEVEKYLDGFGSELNASIDKQLSTSNIIIILGMIAGSVVAGIVIFLVAPGITRPVKKFMDSINSFAHGNYQVDLKIDSKDEFGEMTEQLIKLRNAQKEKISAARNIADGIFEKVKPASAEDELAICFNKEVDTIQELMAEIEQLTEAASNGDLKVRGVVEKYNGGFKKIVSGFNQTLDTLIHPINESVEVLTIMATGDLTARVVGDYKGDHQLIKNSINAVSESLSRALEEVTESVSATASAANQISSSSEEMAAGANEQSAQTAEIATSMEQMTTTILKNTKNASFAAETAKNAGVKAKQGGKVVHETIEGMNRISIVVEKSAEMVFALGKNSDKIGEIIQVIDDIADQTNLLALNAAIEAARAGEQGRGFAVVADEVRKLAERTTKATKEIAGMIKTIQNETSQAVKSMEEGTHEVENGKRLAKEAEIVLNDIIDVAQKVSDTVIQVAAASEEQSGSSELISKNIEGINNVTKETSQGISQIARASEDLSQLTVNLQDLIAKFKISQRAGGFRIRSNGKLIEA
ncbi:hypothetical protein C0389_06320 [bacterium]|nr:hypothetical protein [bacterium]